MDVDECMKILSARARQPANTIEDIPNVENLNVLGQSSVFDSRTYIGDASLTSHGENSSSSGAYGDRNADSVAGVDDDMLSKVGDMSVLELLNLFTTLQGDRVQTYRDFDRIFTVLLENAQINRYSALCSEMTCRFSVISKYIIKVKEALESTKHNRKDLAQIVSKVQEKEKEKLTVVAAIHLDKLKTHLPALKGELSQGPYEHIDGGEYLIKKIQQLEESVSEDLEEIQSAKSESK